MDKTFDKFYDDTVRIWGEEAQIRMCVEEMSELTKELCKYSRYVSIAGQASQEKIDEVKQNIIEETADVLNCASQMARIFGEDEVQKVREKKKDRTFPRLDDYKKLLKVKDTTLIYIVKDGKVVLGEKLRGFGTGKVNGAGGKVEENETIEDGAKRELEEEFGVKAKNLEYVGSILYDEYKGDDKIYYDTHIFVTHDYDGELKQTDEMKPMWFDIDNLPYDKTFPDDKYWLEDVLKGKKINAIFRFDKEFNLISKNVYLR